MNDVNVKKVDAELQEILESLTPGMVEQIRSIKSRKGACLSCPFACTEESEQAQNYGCLPEPRDILKMKKETNQNWACHSNEKRMCQGFKTFVEESNSNPMHYSSVDCSTFDLSQGGLISYDVWYQEGEEEAIRRAKEGPHG